MFEIRFLIEKLLRHRLIIEGATSHFIQPDLSFKSGAFSLFRVEGESAVV